MVDFLFDFRLVFAMREWPFSLVIDSGWFCSSPQCSFVSPFPFADRIQ